MVWLVHGVDGRKGWQETRPDQPASHTSHPQTIFPLVNIIFVILMSILLHMARLDVITKVTIKCLNNLLAHYSYVVIQPLKILQYSS